MTTDEAFDSDDEEVKPKPTAKKAARRKSAADSGEFKPKAGAGAAGSRRSTRKTATTGETIMDEDDEDDSTAMEVEEGD